MQCKGTQKRGFSQELKLGGVSGSKGGQARVGKHKEAIFVLYLLLSSSTVYFLRVDRDACVVADRFWNSTFNLTV